jgi:hypothetical protein
MNILLILVLLGILSLIAYLIFVYVYKPWSIRPKLITRGPQKLSESYVHPFFPSAVEGANFTFSFYVKPDVIDRTLSADTQAILPILTWENTFLFGITPVKGKKDINTGTVATIRLAGGESEIIVCPALPMQKWTYVAISIEGRRLDITYNGRIVVSRILKAMPIINKGGRLLSGSPTQTGTIGILSFSNQRLSAEEIMIDYVSSSDTRGQPYLETFDIPGIGKLFSCPAGAFCFKPSSPPNIAGVAWDTQFG